MATDDMQYSDDPANDDAADSAQVSDVVADDVTEPQANSGVVSHIGQPKHDPVLQHTPAKPVPPVKDTPDQAEDIDLIEKAWVEKAKDIVDKTHGDPFTQSKQLNQIKADYIKKRYNRDVKTDE